MNKKADGNAFWVVVVAIIAFIVFFLLTYTVVQGFQKGKTFYEQYDELPGALKGTIDANLKGLNIKSGAESRITSCLNDKDYESCIKEIENSKLSDAKKIYWFRTVGKRAFENGDLVNAEKTYLEAKELGDDVDYNLIEIKLARQKLEENNRENKKYAEGRSYYTIPDKRDYDRAIDLLNDFINENKGDNAKKDVVAGAYYYLGMSEFKKSGDTRACDNMLVGFNPLINENRFINTQFQADDYGLNGRHVRAQALLELGNCNKAKDRRIKMDGAALFYNRLLFEYDADEPAVKDIRRILNLERCFNKLSRANCIDDNKWLNLDVIDKFTKG